MLYLYKNVNPDLFIKHIISFLLMSLNILHEHNFIDSVIIILCIPLFATICLALDI